MDQFNFLVFGLSSVLEECIIDIVGKLPEEMSVSILRMLDSRTLLSAAMVSKKWRNLCHADLTLRTRIRQQIRHEKKENLSPFVVNIVRKYQNNPQPLAALNGVHKITVSAVPNIRSRHKKIQLPVIQCFTVPAVRQSQTVSMKRKLSKMSGKTNNASKIKTIRV